MIDGLDITRLPEAGVDRFRAEKIGYVFQTFNLMQGFTALENVLLGMTFARGRNDPGTVPGHCLQRVGLGHRLHHKPNALSVGEQQRVAVARAMANRPKLLLADEPTANVDAANQQQVIDLIRQSCAAGAGRAAAGHACAGGGRASSIVSISLNEINQVR